MKRNALALVLGGLIVFLGGIAALDAASAEKNAKWICTDRQDGREVLL